MSVSFARHQISRAAYNLLVSTHLEDVLPESQHLPSEFIAMTFTEFLIGEGDW